VTAIAIVFAAALLGCGGSAGTSTTSGTGSAERAAATTTEAATGYPVPQAPPHKGPLDKLVVRDLRVGKGPVARWGDEVAVRYVGLVYQTGAVYSQHWKAVPPLVFELDGESFGVGFQKGIEGMRVGGRREVLIPSRLLYQDEDVAYLVGLLRVKQKPR
jgi:peptidylprolyl isomerase